MGFIEALISLPLVLPPTVLGFYLLLAFSPNSAFGAFVQQKMGVDLLFSFPGLVIASVIYSLPFMIQPLKTGFGNVPLAYSEASHVLGKSRLKTLLKVELPNMKSAILTAFTLTFAHTLGEFGVVLMIGGNIPGVTRVASIAIYDDVESMNYVAANQNALALLLISFAILILVYSFSRKYTVRMFQ